MPFQRRGSRTIIRKIIAEKNFAKIKELVSKDPKLINKKDKDIFSTPIFWEYFKDCPLENFIQLNNCSKIAFHLKDSKKNTLLHHLAFHNRADILEYIFNEEDVKTSCRNKSGSTALHSAVKGDSSECCEILLRKDFSLKYKTDNRKKTALEYAKNLEFKECSDVISNTKSHYSFFKPAELTRDLYRYKSMVSLNGLNVFTKELGTNEPLYDSVSEDPYVVEDRKYQIPDGIPIVADQQSIPSTSRTLRSTNIDNGEEDGSSNYEYNYLRSDASNKKIYQCTDPIYV